MTDATPPADWPTHNEDGEEIFYPRGAKSSELHRTKQQLIAHFVEYLTYDANNVCAMQSFVRTFPLVLTDSAICQSVLSNRDCYNTLKQTGWWDEMMEKQESDTMVLAWLDNNHIFALAYDAPEQSLRQVMPWHVYDEMVGDEDRWHIRKDGDPDDYYRARACVALATRLDPHLAPLVCAGHRLIIPQNELLLAIDNRWDAWGRAQYGWFVQHIPSPATVYPSDSPQNIELRQAHRDAIAWKSHMPPEAFAPLELVHDMNKNRWEDTLDQWFLLAKDNNLVQESLDHTIGVDDEPSP